MNRVKKNPVRACTRVNAGNYPDSFIGLKGVIP